ncbi:MAG: hypothetical protein LBK99_19645 [Opitutaceae bacterium]|jgi:hypothetical protein|nr:hypothetical protein [Opitutaceae bacterium]
MKTRKTTSRTSPLRRLLVWLALPALFAPAASLHAQTTTTRWDGSESNKWENADNWDNGLPTPNQNTHINTGSVLLDTPATVRYLYLGTDTSATADLTIADGTTLSIGGAATSRIGTGTGANATITQTGGTVTLNANNNLDLGGMSSGGTRTGGTATYTISGGSLIIANANGLMMSANTSGSSTSRFTQTGGTVTLGGLAVGAGRSTGGTGTSANNATYAISGGTLTVNGDLAHGVTTTNGVGLIDATTQITGSKATINIGGNLTLNHNTRNTSTLAFTLDDGGVSRINVTGNATLAGTLTAGLKGGLAFIKTNTFTLIDVGGTLSGSFATGPDSALWETATTTGGLTLSLAAAAQKGANLDVSTATIDTPLGTTFAATTSGYVEIRNLTAGQEITLLLTANAGTGKTIDDLAAWFTDNGHAATALAGTDGYNLGIAKTATDTTAFLSWDLTPFNADAALSAVGLSTTAIPEPATWATIAALALLACVVACRRKRTIIPD